MKFEDRCGRINENMEKIIINETIKESWWKWFLWTHYMNIFLEYRKEYSNIFN